MPKTAKTSPKGKATDSPDVQASLAPRPYALTRVGVRDWPLGELKKAEERERLKEENSRLRGEIGSLRAELIKGSPAAATDLPSFINKRRTDAAA